MSAAPVLEWDMDTVGGFTDATCQTEGITIDTGNPDEHFLFPSGTATIQLDNRDGRWSQYTADGLQAQHGPGYELAIWATDRTTNSVWWLFRGTITRWDDHATDDIVRVEAFDPLATLAQPIGTYTPGVNGQLPGPRLEAVMTAAGRSATIAHRFDTGDATLTAQTTDKAPLEEMQIVAASDGGALFVDADGTLLYLKRSWRNGRTDQPSVPVASDNVCTVPVVVWDCVLSSNDDGQAQTVILENVAQLRAVAPAGATGITGVIYSETDQQWSTQTEGDTLASIIQATQADARVNVDEFVLYLLDPLQPDIHRAVEWRLLDVLRFLHDNRNTSGGFTRLDMGTLITAISHDITPNGWVMTVRTDHTLSPNAVLSWNPTGDPYWWDATNYVWGF